MAGDFRKELLRTANYYGSAHVLKLLFRTGLSIVHRLLKA